MPELHTQALPLLPLPTGVVLPSMVVTLAMNAVAQGLMIVHTGGFSPQDSSSPAMRVIATGDTVFGIPNAVLVWAAVGVAAVFLLTRTTFGRTVYAIGNRERAAYLSGARTRLVVTAAFALSGGLSAFGGVLLAGYASKAAQAMGDAARHPSGEVAAKQRLRLGGRLGLAVLARCSRRYSRGCHQRNRGREAKQRRAEEHRIASAHVTSCRELKPIPDSCWLTLSRKGSCLRPQRSESTRVHPGLWRPERHLDTRIGQTLDGAQVRSSQGSAACD